MKIYVDILFAQYFIINYFIIEVTSNFLREKTKRKNKILSAIIASTYSIIVIFNHLKFANSFVGKIFLSIIIVIISYNPKNISDIASKAMILYITTYILGGIFSSITNDISNQHIALVLSALLCLVTIMILKKVLKSIVNQENYACNIKIVVNEKIVMAKALIDTGHNLQDVVTGDTVIIINEDKIEEISEELLKVLKNMMPRVPEEYQTKIRMISYSSLGNQSDVLCGIKADSIVAYYNGKEIENKHVVVAMSKNEFKDFDAIVSLNLIEGGYAIGNSSIIKVKS